MKVDIVKIKEICEANICPECPLAKGGTMSCIMINVPSAWNIEEIGKAYEKAYEKAMKVEESEDGADNEYNGLSGL